jgi:glycosyltransferase involved in cell wall biosynthesis
MMGCLAEVAQQMKKVIVYETDDLLHRVEQNIGKHKLGGQDIKDQLRFIDWLIPNANLMTVSTDYLNEFYGGRYKKQIFTMPNFYDPAMWRGLYLYKKLRDFWRKKIRKDNTIRIGWQGGNNHFLNNFNYIVDPLNVLAKKYGKKIQFVALAGQHPNLDPFGGAEGKRKFLDFDFEYRKPVSVMKFPRSLAEMDLDIGLIMVEDNEFSRAKSNIKWLEYSLLGIPSISSNVLPYQKTNAILVDNSTEEWLSALEDLVNNKKKRAIMGSEAHKMTKEFNVLNHASELETIYRKALEKVGD